MTVRDAAELLKVGDNPSTAEIKAAFRLQVRLTHPDMTGTSATERAFSQVVEAYQLMLTIAVSAASVGTAGDAIGPIKLSSHGKRPGLTDRDHWLVFYWSAYFVEVERAFGRPRTSFVRYDCGNEAFVSLFIKPAGEHERWKRIHWFSFIHGDTPMTYRRLVTAFGEPVRVTGHPVSEDDETVDCMRRRIRDTEEEWRRR